MLQHADSIWAPSTDGMALAVSRLRAGELVGFPTETVYGLGADAANERAIVKLFALKGRPANHPVIVHLAPNADLERWARRIPPAARTVIEKFAPGPLTLILPKSDAVSDVVTGGQKNVVRARAFHDVEVSMCCPWGQRKDLHRVRR